MVNVSDEVKFLRYAKVKMQKQELFLLIILVNQQAVGMIDFHNFNQITKQAEVGYWLSEKYEKRGIMTKSLRWLMAYGFNSLKLKKIEIQVDKKNNNSLKIPRRLGFSEDKIIKNFAYYNGQHHDFVIFSQTK
ncbi:GNAT family N-acetyltransferase [Streptococcus sp. CSL7591-lung]|uniref:GNAT family N-acetyltransferase n=2 Tax=Streptococcus pacificus TaxID=2740577 RepID=A0ABS0ZI70_9STRE|nr:GNAT family N-acetyltransferase [Streptococcus pacificus]